MAKKKGFEFQFKNPILGTEDALTNVLFINDTPSESDILKLVVAAVPEVTVTFKPVPDKVGSDENYHFKLTCKPDTLALPAEILLDASHDALWGMVFKVESPPAASADGERAEGDAAFYFLYKGTSNLAVTAANPLSLTLRKVGAASKGGTRPAITELTLNTDMTDFDKFVVLAGPPGPYNPTEYANLDLVAPRILAVPTLMAGFVSSDIVLNDGDTENYLLLRIVNTGLLPISLAPEGSASPSKLTLRFAADDNIPTRVWALAKIAQVSSILIPGKPDSTTTDPNWSGKDAWTVTARPSEQRWELKPKAAKITLAPDEAIEVPISKIVTGHATGRTALRIAYSGLPGFGDGELVAFIQKYPLVYAGQKVGVGTGSGVGPDSPSAKLTVETAPDDHGLGHTDGTRELTTYLNQEGGWIGLTSGHDLHFFTAHGARKMTLTNGGKLGIGTTTPAEILHVQGNLRVNGELKNAGPFTFRANTDDSPAGEDLARFMDKDDKQVLTLKSDGKLGIGTTDPSYMLTVHTDGWGIAQTNGTVTLMTGLSNTGAALGTKTNHDLLFYTNNSPQMTLTADGKLGIGTTTPDYPLQVKTAPARHGLSHTDGTRTLTTFVNDSGGWFGTTSGHALNFFIGGDGPHMTLKADGRLSLKEKPFECWTAILPAANRGSGASLRSPYRTAEWVGIVAGYLCNAYDDPNDKEVSFYCRIQPNNDGFWYAHGFHEAGHSRWVVQVLFIRRELVKNDFVFSGWSRDAEHEASAGDGESVSGGG